MNRALLVVVMLLIGSGALGQSTLMDISWSKLKAKGQLQAGEVVTRAGVETLKVSNPSGKPLRVTLVSIKNPGIACDTYAIVGQVAYEDVKGRAYLETMNYFVDDGPFFSRTVESRGEMRYITGTSGPRRFFLPFFLKNDNVKPTKTEFNVFIPGRGTIYIGPAKLVQDILGEQQDRQETVVTGALGGVIGTLFGLLGAVIGVLSSRGKCRSFVMGSLAFMMVVGGVCGVLAVAAIATERSSSVYLPFLVLAVLLTVLSVFARPEIIRRYDELELRRITARDAGG